MSNKKIQMLAKILEDEKLFKLAQQTGAEGVVDKESADNLAEQIFDQLFLETVQDIGK